MIGAEPSYSVTRRIAEVIELRIGHERATFTIDQQPERRYFALSIESTYGGYSFAWTHPAGDFKRFLAELNVGYVMGKMVGSDRVYSGERTASAIREELDRLVAAGEVDPGEAEDEHLLVDEVESSSVVDFSQWCDETRVFREREPWLFQRDGPGPREREFAALYEIFWPALAAELTRGPS